MRAILLRHPGEGRDLATRGHGGPRRDPGLRRDDGFTLVELLVSLLIFAMLSAAGVTLLRFSVNAQNAAETRLGDLGQLRRTGALLAADLAQAAPRLSRDEAGVQRPAFVGGTGEGSGPALAFVRRGVENPDNAPRPSLQKIEYRLVSGGLQRRSWSFVDGAAPKAETILVDGVRRIRFRYRDERGDWRDRWDPTRAVELPRAVELVMETESSGSIRQLFLTAADL